jgi:hypothetical protein
MSDELFRLEYSLEAIEEIFMAKRWVLKDAADDDIVQQLASSLTSAPVLSNMLSPARHQQF